jgi:hypothetical protein
MAGTLIEVVVDVAQPRCAHPAASLRDEPTDASEPDDSNSDASEVRLCSPTPDIDCLALGRPGCGSPVLSQPVLVGFRHTNLGAGHVRRCGGHRNRDRREGMGPGRAGVHRSVHGPSTNGCQGGARRCPSLRRGVHRVDRRPSYPHPSGWPAYPDPHDRRVPPRRWALATRDIALVDRNCCLTGKEKLPHRSLDVGQMTASAKMNRIRMAIAFGGVRCGWAQPVQSGDPSEGSRSTRKPGSPIHLAQDRERGRCQRSIAPDGIRTGFAFGATFWE